MALRCGLPLDALSLLLPAAPAFSRSPSFQNPLLARAILNAAPSRPIPTRDLPSTFHPPHLDPFPSSPSLSAQEHQKEGNHAQLALLLGRDHKNDDGRYPMTNAARYFSCSSPSARLPALHASLLLESI